MPFVTDPYRTSSRVRRPRRRAALAGLAALAGVVAAATPGQAVIGGAPAPAAESWMASLRSESGQAFCGGTLIDRRWVVTAYHCVGNRDADDLRIRIGSRSSAEGGTLAGVERVVGHPDASFVEGGGFTGPDLALLRLDRPVRHQPLRTGTAAPRIGTPARALGWGNMCWDALCTPEVLQEITLPVSQKRGDHLVFNNAALRGVGPGDSGGPLVVQRKGTWRLAGVTSSNGRSQDGAVSNFVDVSRYRGWIDKVL
ncbi:S1 family peptidase [Streptomyces cadmiisoli]|uniref:Serine protease n=1 Tax=Streptomyces cadmiisoli TaxID=2184053 RepID=A0A2Z4JDC7_9ACTN|nr:serine protease [Streptomyces cadmiisoli]AWW43076.1 serine protease [Streptomyces cadmiisoli]